METSDKVYQKFINPTEIKRAGKALISVGWYSIIVIILSIAYVVFKYNLLEDQSILTPDSLQLLKLVNMIYAFLVFVLSLSLLSKFFEAGIALKNAAKID